MATDGDISSDPISLSKREVEDKEMTSELSNITATEASQEEKKSLLSKPPEIIDMLEKTEIEDVANDDEVANMNVINKDNVEKFEVFSQSLLVANENPEKYTEDSQMTSGDEKSKTSTNSVVMDVDPETIGPNIAMEDMKNKHGSSLPVEETSFEKAGQDVGECIEENMSIPYKEASKETFELTEKMKDSTSIQDEDLNKNLESSFAQNVEDVLFRKVDNLETSPRESESGMKNIVKESQYESQNEKEIFENIASADRDQSKMGRHGEIHDTKADASFRKPRESTERENEDLITTEVLLKGRHEEDMGVTDEDEIVAEEQEKHETSTHEEQLEQRHMQKTVGKTPMDSKEIETEGSNKHAETITNIEDQRTDGIPGEIIGEKRKDETIIVDDFDKEIQKAKNFPIDLDEKTTSAEFEISNKSGGDELFVTHSPIEEEIQAGGENEDEVSMSQSDDRRKIIQNPNKEKKCVNETFEATKSPESTISEHVSIEGALNVRVISTSTMDLNIEKGCELNSEEELKKIRAEEIVKEEREQIEKASNAKFSVERKSDDNEESTVHADILVKNKTPLSSGEEYHHDQEEKVRSNNFKEEFTETDSGDQIDIISKKIDNINDIINREVCEDLNMADRSEYIEKDMKNEESTVTDCSPEPAGERTTNCSQGNQMEAKKKTAEVSEGYDTYIASLTLRESDITDLRSSYVQEEEAEESLTAYRRDTGISDKEVWSTNIERRERDFDATYCMKEKIDKDLKAEAKARWNTQNIAGSSEAAAAAQKEGNINLVQNTSAPELIEKEIKIEILEKEEDSKDKVEAEETRLTEAEAEFPIRVNSSNQISEEKGQVSETSDMGSIGTDIIAEPAEISILGDNKDMEITAERKDGSNEAIKKTQTESKNETCHELSESENQKETATVETSFRDITEQDLVESSTMQLEVVTEVTEVTGEAPERGKNLYAREEIPSVAETTEKYIVVKEDESETQKNDTNTGSIGVGKERSIDDDWVKDRELHLPLVLNNGKSISETDVELLKGVNAGETANDSEVDKLDTSEDEKSSYIVVEKDKIEYQEAVDKAFEGVEVGGGCIVTENAIMEQEDSDKNFKSSSKKGVESEARSCGSETLEIQTISTKTETKRDVDDKELTSELPRKNAESWFSQPPETIEILETECMQVPHHLEVGKVNTETTSIEQDLKETSFEGEGKKSNTSSSSMGLEIDPEATQPSTDKDVCISNETASQDNHETNEQTESNVDSENNLGNSLVSALIEETSSEKVGPPVCKNLEENSSMACKDESQETGKLSDRMKDDATIENEVQNQNLESSFVKEVENLETSKEQIETGMGVDNETQKEAENQSETLENTTTSNLSAEDEDVEIPERKAQVSVMKLEESTTRNTEDVTSEEALTVECEPEVMVVPGTDYVVVNEQETTEKSKQEEHSEQSFKQNTEPENANMGSPSTVASEEFKTTSLEDYAERISNINEERPIRIPKQILGKTIIAVDINENEITEAKNLSTVDVGEKTRSAEVKFPDNISNEVYITHSPVENPFPNKDETQNDVSMLESQEQDRNETSEHEEHSKQGLMQDTETATANLGKSSIVASEFETTSHNEYVDSITNNQEARTDGSPEEILGETRNDQTMITDDINSKELPEAESLSAVDLDEKNRSADVKILDDKNRSAEVEIPNNSDEVCVSHPPKEETVLEGGKKQNEVSTLELADQVHEASASEVPKDEGKHANDSCEASKSAEYKLLEHTSTEGAINGEVTSTRSTKETPVGSQEEILGETRKDKTMIADHINCKQLPQAKGLSAVNLDEKNRSADVKIFHEKNRSAEVKIPNNGDEVCVRHPPMDETILEGGKKKNEVSMLQLADQVHEASASEFPKDEEKHANDSYEASKSPECKLLEHTSTEGAINVEVTPTRSPKETPTGSQDEILVETRKDETMIADYINNKEIPEAEVLETILGGQDAHELVKSLPTSSNTGSQQTTKTSDAIQHELQEISSMMSQFPLNEQEKSENISANLERFDTYHVEGREFETPGAVPDLKNQGVREFHDTSLPEEEEEEAHTNEIENKNREVHEALSEEITQCVETVSEDEIIAPAVTREETSLGEVRLNEHVEVLDTHSSTKHLDTIKISDASQHDAEIENTKLEKTRLVVSQLPIHEQEETENENILVKKSKENDNKVEKTKIPDTVSEFEDQAVKKIHEADTSLNVGGADTNEIENPVKEVPEALSEPIKQYVDVAGDNEIESGQTLQGEKLEERLQASSSGFLSTEQESETTTTNEQGSTDKDDIEGTKILQVEITEDLETTSEGKEIENQVQEVEKIVHDWSKVCSAEEMNTKSSRDNAMMTKAHREEVVETNQGGHDTGEHIKALDTSSDTESLQKPDASKEELEETSTMVSYLPMHEYEKADNKSITVDTSDAYGIEVKETELLGVEPESKDQRIKEVHEAGTRVEQTQTMEMETQIREIREALSEVVNQGPEAVSEDEIIGASVATKVTSLETPDTVKTAYDNQHDAQFESKKCEVTYIIMSQLPIHEHEKAESENIPAEKSDANDVEVGETGFTDKVPESEDQAVKEIHETGTSLTEGEADINKIEKQIREVPEALSEPTNSSFNTCRIDEMTPVQALRAENTEEQLQVSSSDLLSKEKDGETSLGIEMGCTDKDGTEIGKLRLQEDSATVFQLPTTEFNSAKNVIEEKSYADEVELNETRTYDAVSKSENRGFEVIPDIGASPAAENTETDKIKEQIKEETEKIVDLTYQGVDAGTDGENLDHPLPVDKSEEQIQLSSSSYESTKEDETELNNSELEEATGMMPRFPSTESEILHMRATIKMSEADKVQIEEDKTSEAISDSKWDIVEEIKEIGSSTLVGNTRADEDKEETKAVPETIFKPTCQGTETATDGDIAINQTLTTGGVEQLEESKRTTEPTCLQEEGRREFEVSNLELKVQDSQDRSPEEENTGLEKGSTDAPSEYEARPIKDCSRDSNKDADNLPPSCPTVTKLSTEDVSGKCEEACNLWFEKNETSKEMQGARNFDPISLQEDTSTMTVQGDELRAEDYPGQIKDKIFEAPRNEMVFEESEEAIVNKNTEEAVTADDKGPYQVSVGCEIANVTKNTEAAATADDKGPREVSVRREITNVTPQEAAKNVQNIQKTPYQSELKSHGDETDIADTGTEANAHIKEVFEESEEASINKNTEEEVTADDKGPYQVSVGCEIANVTKNTATDDDKGPCEVSVRHEITNVAPGEAAKNVQNIQKTPYQSELKSHGDETDIADTEREAIAHIKEFKSTEVMLVSCKEERTGDNDNMDGQLQKTDLAVAQITDASAEEAPDGKEVEIFDISEPAPKGPTHGIIEPYEHEKEIGRACTINSESLKDNEKLRNITLEPACKGSGGTEDRDQNKKDGTNERISSTTPTLEETMENKESQKVVDTKQHDFIFVKPTAEVVSSREGNSFQHGEHTKDKETVELSIAGNERKFDEAMIQTITAIEEEKTQQENEKCIDLPHIKDSEKGISHEEVVTNTSEGIHGLEKNSLPIPHVQIASKTDPSESIECTSLTANKDVPLLQDDVDVEDFKSGHALGSELEAKGKECGEENRMGEELVSATMSLSDLLQRSTKRNLQVVEDSAEEREVMANRETPQNEGAETTQSEEAGGIHGKKDEEEEGDELRKEDSGSDAPVMAEASRDMDVKIAHKKSHHLLSGVGSKVKHSLSKVKKAITGKSPSKPTSPK